jgi:hypothetical protein
VNERQTSAARPEPDELEATERWFLDRGIPHFIEDYRASEDILTRAAPALVLVFFVSTVSVFREEWTGWRQALVVAATFACLVLLWVVVNLVLRRSPFALPTKVTALEVAVVVVVPPLIAYVVGRHLVGALVLLAIQLLLLGIIYLSASYAVLPILRWAGAQVIHQVGDVMRVLTRALPMLLLFNTFLFINTEVWQVAASLSNIRLAGVLVLFGAVAIVFVVVWLAEELDHVDDEFDPVTVASLCADTPMASALDGRNVRVRPLSRKQRANMLLVLVFSQLIQAAMVAGAVFGFFVVFGLLAIGTEVQTAWLGTPSGAALYQVAGLLAMFSALYFAVYAVTDGTYRAQFFAPIRQQMDKAVAVRAVYLAARDSGA